LRKLLVVGTSSGLRPIVMSVSYAAKIKTASECGEVPMRGSKYCHYLIVIISLYE
jgi:hypothetical protein